MYKIFRNVNKNDGSVYYKTNFYNYDKQTSEEIKRDVNVYFQHGYEPDESIDVDFYAKDSKGNEYGVILSCYKKMNIAEPKLVLIKRNETSKIDENNKQWAKEIKETKYADQFGSSLKGSAFDDDEELPF